MTLRRVLFRVLINAFCIGVLLFWGSNEHGFFKVADYTCAVAQTVLAVWIVDDYLKK